MTLYQHLALFRHKILKYSDNAILTTTNGTRDMVNMDYVSSRSNNRRSHDNNRKDQQTDIAPTNCIRPSHRVKNTVAAMTTPEPATERANPRRRPLMPSKLVRLSWRICFISASIASTFVSTTANLSETVRSGSTSPPGRTTTTSCRQIDAEQDLEVGDPFRHSG